MARRRPVMTDLRDIPTFSLVVATLGRTAELDRLLGSLAAQERADVEIVIVDQNGDDRLGPVLDQWSGRLPITWLRGESLGVCRARNTGAAAARGEWLIFPDDDCWYPAQCLTRLETLTGRHPAAFHGGRAADRDGRTIMGTFAAQAGPITRQNVWSTMIEWMLAIRAPAFAEVGGFDPAIGPGAGTPWGAYEAQDLALKLLEAGHRGHYDPGWFGHHPDDRSDQTTASAIAKIRLYSQGLGYVMRRHGYRFGDYVPRLLRPLAGMISYGATGRIGMARRSRAILAARWMGWTSAPLREGGTPETPAAP